MHSCGRTQLLSFVTWIYSYKCSHFHKIQDFLFCSVSILHVMEASCQILATSSDIVPAVCQLLHTSVMGALVSKGNALSWRPRSHQSDPSGSVPATGAATVCLLFRQNAGACRPQASQMQHFTTKTNCDHWSNLIIRSSLISTALKKPPNKNRQFTTSLANLCTSSLHRSWNCYSVY